MPGPARPATSDVLAAALLAGVLAPLNSTMIVVALPEVLADLDASLAWGSWIVVSYLVAMAAVQPLGGSLGDRFGRRRVMLLGLTGFALASLLAALATSVELLVLARTIQAITGASAIPNAHGPGACHPRRRVRAERSASMAWVSVSRRRSVHPSVDS
jgi:MFS family permease